jgi:hypothetical protein
MPLMLMSNPGLHLALLGNPGLKRHGFPSRKRFTQASWRAKKRVGKRYKIKGGGSYRVSRASVIKRRSSPKRHAAGISWSGKLGGVRYSGAVRRGHSRSAIKTAWTNPRRRKHRSSRRNPVGVINQYIGAVKRAPHEVMAVFKGRNKIKNIAYAAGGAVGTYAIGGIITASVVVPVLNMVGAGRILANPIGKRVVGGLVPLTVGFVANKFIKGDIGKALMVGGAAASIIELVSPGMIARLVYGTPVVGPMAVAAAPAAAVRGPVNGMEGLGGYVDANAYQGTGGYVDANAYQGTGEVEGYVDANAYQGTGDTEDDLASDDLAGVDGYLTDSSKYMQTYLN